MKHRSLQAHVFGSLSPGRKSDKKCLKNSRLNSKSICWTEGLCGIDVLKSKDLRPLPHPSLRSLATRFVAIGRKSTVLRHYTKMQSKIPWVKPFVSKLGTNMSIQSVFLTFTVSYCGPYLEGEQGYLEVMGSRIRFKVSLRYTGSSKQPGMWMRTCPQTK